MDNKGRKWAKKAIIFFTILACIISLQNCKSSKINDRIRGFWNLDFMALGEYEIKLPFEVSTCCAYEFKDSICYIPTFTNEHKSNRKAKYKIEKMKLLFETQNSYFNNDTFNILILNDTILELENNEKSKYLIFAKYRSYVR